MHRLAHGQLTRLSWGQQGNLGPVQGSNGLGIDCRRHIRATTGQKPVESDQNGRRTGQQRGVHGLNFYVAPGRPLGLPWGSSLQYSRLLLARAMTGEFAAAWLPSVFVPLVGILGPAVAMALLFNVIEARD